MPRKWILRGTLFGEIMASIYMNYIGPNNEPERIRPNIPNHRNGFYPFGVTESSILCI